MREAGFKKTGCFPYGMVLTRIFDHFEIPLHDESVKEKPMSPYNRTAVERMHWFFDQTNGTWSYKGPEKPEAFQIMKARLDTLVVDINAFKEDHGRQIQALQDSQQAQFDCLFKYQQEMWNYMRQGQNPPPS
ncbi:hypothetical protein PanWU01x14_089250 [Parasponia andersonii]|uniref:Uncharacterized protein n=1 Tax=Parasponia andersonii TaxID=3476 RepID=A0A2P5D7C8_PARAD|nr:hypothetical protein PanWU01x14_089250 [Parasponia andersonii]